MAVPTRLGTDGSTFESGTPVALFPAHIGNPIPPRQQYLVSDGGERFLMSNIIDESTSPITLILNWHPMQQ
jgi:hypothetical protein